MNKKITVFGSGAVPKDSEEWKIAYRIGQLLAQKGFIVVNGGYGGSMEAAHQGAKEAGGTTIGITTDQFAGSTKNKFVDDEIRMTRWCERLHRLAEVGDGFIVLNGGTGTLTELMVVLEMQNKRMHLKPVVILGSEIKKFLQNVLKSPNFFLPPLVCTVDSPEDAVQYLEGEIFQ
ncbi:MAG: hypothetical protein A3G33_00440 [Omnitrophica bacterium RIFCSPLOWO2_12_FULL_44_17]|uniref:DNA-binding protein n=1 Tax=Candidatus Danuiimicrobium aquiferis TaxID=1801832 RepID=A0A1G1KSM2_9BACT|nr:MAG: hypothetical protein A3B72_08010 [Omnitrophica bacterium RIFCSPHIGHO2_02_FULL_45_28]OGW89708.1 MAG: hypothetical protein A3E74_09000 [Omnitrophica bacterium RIFCSPHIGHO2_12_FULL_44_12]OGW95845.1 MAG: hypothetical protein A3G33_00440 [Omnitrophica bacterium RIFCSPLOWO2_12_FULL_44_17]OGX01946.1 MAG: hypothetical protein A3J12_01850 [Omnitrophica bacterium RIFCSPLOWO2_02_FULL_44_11]